MSIKIVNVSTIITSVNVACFNFDDSIDPSLASAPASINTDALIAAMAPDALSVEPLPYTASTFAISVATKDNPATAPASINIVPIAEST